MKLTTTWAFLGSLAINIVLGLLIAAVFSVTPAKAADLPARTAPTQERSATPVAPRRKQDYLTPVRMGWTI